VGSVFLADGYSETAARPRSGGALKVGLLRDITNLNPFVENLSSNAMVRGLVYESIVAVDLSDEVVPSLAESWAISGDGKEYTFHLRKGVTFHNGKELDAEDVKWTLEYILEPKNRAYTQGSVSDISKVLLIDQRSFKLILREPFSPLLAVGLSEDTPVLPKNSVRPGETIIAAPPGTGPFQFIEWVPMSHVRLTANKRYWRRGIPYLDAVMIKPVPSGDVRFLALRTGDIDVNEAVPYAVVNDIKKGKYPEIKLFPASVSAFRMIKMNVEAPYFNNPKVRRAVASAIDRKEYIDAFAFGYGEPAYQVSPKGHKWYLDDVKNMEMDLERAKALLAEAGYPSGFKSYLEARQGEEGEAAILQSQLKRVGIDLEIKSMDFAQLRKVTLDGQYNIRVGGSAVYSDIDRALHTNFHSEAGPRRSRNHTGYKNPEADRLLDRARAVSDFKERRELYKKATEIINNDSAQVNLAFIVEFFGHRTHVKGFTTNPNGELTFPDGGIPFTWVEDPTHR
jgi:ABC-type transport system substrate-binding protein